MDRVGSLGQIVAILLGIMMRYLPVFLLAGAGAWFLTRSHFGRALTGRLRAGADAGETLATLMAHMEQVQRELAEVQERLDFTERLLARRPDAEPVAPPEEDRTPTPPGLAAAGRP